MLYNNMWPQGDTKWPAHANTPVQEVKGQRAEVRLVLESTDISNANVGSHGNEQVMLIIVQKGKQSVIFIMLDATQLQSWF